MTKTAALLIALIVTALPAHAQQRVFVSGLGLDTNPCSVTQPCRTFAHAYTVVAANGDYAGLLSGGCLEGDLREHALSVIETGEPRIVSYDLFGP